MVIMGRIVSVVCALVAAAGVASGDPLDGGPELSLDKRIAVWRFDALGIDPEIVAKLETMFREELARLDKKPLASRREIESKVTASEQNCTGEEKCLQSIGKRLGVDFVVTGTVGSLGENYILTIKAVEVSTGKSSKFQGDPLRGTPDELIEGVRVAAYKLLAPDQLHGAIKIESDLIGAQVSLDDQPIGKTPLASQGVIGKLALGKHKLHVDAKGYDAWDNDIEVHFQKVSPVLVHLLPSEMIGTGKTIRLVRSPVYSRPWFLAAVGISAIALSAYIGWRVGQVPCYVDGNKMMPCK
jgi:TolB-like protein